MRATYLALCRIRFFVGLEAVTANSLFEHLSVGVLQEESPSGSVLYDLIGPIPVPLQFPSLACFFPGVVHPDLVPNLESMGQMLGIKLFLLLCLRFLDVFFGLSIHCFCPLDHCLHVLLKTFWCHCTVGFIFAVSLWKRGHLYWKPRLAFV